MLKLKTTKRVNIFSVLVALLLISVWAFNEVKLLTYPIKILYILVLGYYSISRRRTNTYYQLWTLCMILLSLLAMFISPNLNSSLYTFINVFQVFLIGFVTCGFLDDEEKIDFVLECLVIGGLILTLRLIIATPENVWLTWRRLGEAIGSNANDVGNKASFSAIIAICLSKHNSGAKKVMHFVCFGILSAIVLFSGSRKALIALVIGVILINTIGLKDKRKFFLSIVVICVGLFLGYRILMSNEVLYATIGRRIEIMVNVFFHGGSEAQSIDLRKYYIEIALQLIKKHPVFGIGLGAFSSVSGVGVYSHCDYTEVACSYGLIGAFVYYLPLLTQTIQYLLLRKKSYKEYMFLIIQVVLLITYITMVMYTSAYIQILVAVFYSHYKIVIMNRERDLEGNICHNQQMNNMSIFEQLER